MVLLATGRYPARGIILTAASSSSTVIAANTSSSHLYSKSRGWKAHNMQSSTDNVGSSSSGSSSRGGGCSSGISGSGGGGDGGGSSNGISGSGGGSSSTKRSRDGLNTKSKSKSKRRHRDHCSSDSAESKLGCSGSGGDHVVSSSMSSSRVSLSTPSVAELELANMRNRRLEREKAEIKRSAVLLARHDIYGGGDDDRVSKSPQQFKFEQQYSQQYNPHLSRRW